MPLHLIFNLGGLEHHLIMVKCVRMVSGFKVFNVSNIMRFIKAQQTNRLNKLIETNELLARNRDLDQN